MNLPMSSFRIGYYATGASLRYICSVMSEDESHANCLEFQNQLSELMATGVDLRSHPHLKVCELCSLLLHDIYRIAEEAKHGHFGTEEE